MLGIAAIRRLAISSSRAKGEFPTVNTVPNPPATSLRVQLRCLLALRTTMFTDIPAFEMLEGGPPTGKWKLYQLRVQMPIVHAEIIAPGPLPGKEGLQAGG